MINNKLQMTNYQLPTNSNRQTQKTKSNVSQQGQIFIFAIIILSLVIVITVVLLNSSVTFLKNTTTSVEMIQATNLAEAGIDKAVASLNVSGGSYNGESETPMGPGTFSVSISSLNVSSVLVTATGYVPNKLKPLATKTVTIQVSKGIGASFTYGMQVGNGGISMGNT